MRTLGIQNHNSCFIGKLQLQILQTTLFKGINIIFFGKRIKDTDKNDIGWRQQIIFLVLLQQVNIHQCLIVAGTLGQHVVFGVRIFGVLNLHFQIIMRILVICHNDVQTDTTADEFRLKGFFCLQVVDISNFDLQ